MQLGGLAMPVACGKRVDENFIVALTWSQSQNDLAAEANSAPNRHRRRLPRHLL